MSFLPSKLSAIFDQGIFERIKRSRPFLFLRDLVTVLIEHETLDMAAMVAFWSMLSIFPFMILLLTVIGMLQMPTFSSELMALLHQVLPFNSAKLFERSVREVVETRRGWLAGGAFLMSLWAASAGTSGVMTALDRAWVSEKNRSFFKKKLVSLGTTGVGGALLLFMIASLVLAPRLLDLLFLIRLDVTPGWRALWAMARWPLIGLTMFSVLVVTYSWLPAVHWHRLRVVPGALVALVLWLIASQGLSAYVRWGHTYARIYGRLGVLIVLLTWLYLSALTVLIGGEVNALLARKLRHSGTSEGFRA